MRRYALMSMAFAALVSMAFAALAPAAALGQAAPQPPPAATTESGPARLAYVMVSSPT